MEHAIKYFGLNNVALENDLRRVAREKKIQLRPSLGDWFRLME